MSGENSQETEGKAFSNSAGSVSEVHGLQRRKRKLKQSGDKEINCTVVSTTQKLSVQADEVSGAA